MCKTRVVLLTAVVFSTTHAAPAAVRKTRPRAPKTARLTPAQQTDKAMPTAERPPRAPLFGENADLTIDL